MVKNWSKSALLGLGGGEPPAPVAGWSSWWRWRRTAAGERQGEGLGGPAALQLLRPGLLPPSLRPPPPPLSPYFETLLVRSGRRFRCLGRAAAAAACAGRVQGGRAARISIEARQGLRVAGGRTRTGGCCAAAATKAAPRRRRRQGRADCIAAGKAAAAAAAAAASATMLAECDCVWHHRRHRRADGCSAISQIWRRCRRMPFVVVVYAHAQIRSYQMAAKTRQ